MSAYPALGRDPEVLAPRLTRISRAVVREGYMASMWMAGHRRAAGILAAVAVAPKSSDVWIEITSREVSAWSGASAPSVHRVFGALRRAGLVFEGARVERSRRRFLLGARTMPLGARDGFVFPGGLIASGIWPALTPGEQAVAFALAAELRTAQWPEEEFALVNPWVRRWLAANDALDGYTHGDPMGEPDAPEGVRVRIARRTGAVTLERLGELTGMSASAASRCVQGLERWGGDVLSVLSDVEDSRCHWYHLPASGWVAPDYLRDKANPWRHIIKSADLTMAAVRSARSRGNATQAVSASPHPRVGEASPR